jgi:hypothetical protein
MVVYDFVTPENLAKKYPEDGLFIDGSILFKTDPDEYEVNTSFTIALEGQTITTGKYTLQPSGIVIKIQEDGLMEISSGSLQISESIREDSLELVTEIHEYLTALSVPVKGGKRNTRKKSRRVRVKE